ncbi:hypothetical protein SELMODRAFT_102099 [Selaginella moellendorffii]|uniref:Calcineurin-like phosphoesterase domain-containing protein n=1 Tax=Selaginella moellendorffii TaxID=88036 RepID=D8RU97_SELML|nr:hypothetical protein SELMODRAFT_102099 [Selaginella moellendorffii]
MDRVKEILTHQYSYPHEHSRHAMLAVLAGCLFFISTDNFHTLIHRFDNNIKWWSIYAFLLGFFYFFSSPFLVRTIEPSYSNFNRWYVLWLLVAAVYHLPSFQSMGVDIRMNLSLFLTLFMASVLILVLFHISYLGLWYLGLVARLAGNRPEILTILQNSTVLSIACCVFYSHCGNRGPKGKPLGRQLSSTVLFENLLHSNLTKWINNWPPMHEVKEQVCHNWLGPVGSAADYPVFSKWVVYGEMVCHDACVKTSENISPIFSLWATFIGLYIANYIVERSTGWALTHPQPSGARRRKIVTAPEFLDMVPWYSGTSADLFKTAFDLVISVTLFLGRFDLRTMQAAISKAQQTEKDGFLYTHFHKKEEMWFDFMADTGDGGNSTYTVARLLAQPFLKVNVGGRETVLQRSSLLLLGGDLAYPNPSPTSYEQRLFRPFEYAMQPPKFYRPEHIAATKPELPDNVEKLQAYVGPQCFAIPGNHGCSSYTCIIVSDWFDGLETFMRYICHKSWLGGWLLPQEKSYFALQLPHGWWVFGLDQALHGDIDLFQFKYFSEIAKEQVGSKDSVIIITHEPTWLLDWYWEGSTGNNVSHLIKDHLKGRCRLRLSGDLHFYMRHTAGPAAENPASVQHLIVNGCGGAFLHPTHVFTKFSQFEGTTYQNKASYPLPVDSRKIALGNILKFRKKNWRFDIIGGVLYFVLVFSMFPQCDLDKFFQKNTFFGHTRQFFNTVGQVIYFLLEDSYVSLGGLFGMLILAVLFVPGKVSRKKKFLIGFLHCCVHLIVAIGLLLLLELGIETCVRHGLLGNAGYHTLYEWYRSVENEHFPDPTGLRARMERWTLGLYPACLKYLMSAFDVPEVMAVTRSNICRTGLDSMSRGFKLIYYSSVFLYFWVFSTPVVSFIFGSYLYTCINWLNLHFDEAFSSLRIANYKSFLRCHVTKTGDLEVYTLAVDKVPKEWMLDPLWDEEQSVSPSYSRKYPSQWIPLPPYRDANCNVRVIDHFVVSK